MSIPACTASSPAVALHAQSTDCSEIHLFISEEIIQYPAIHAALFLTSAILAQSSSLIALSKSMLVSSLILWNTDILIVETTVPSGWLTITRDWEDVASPMPRASLYRCIYPARYLLLPPTFHRAKMGSTVYYLR